MRQHRFARAQQRADDVDVEHAAPARHAHLVEPGGHIDHASIVDQASQPAQPGVDGLEQAQHLRLVAHVGLHRDRSAAGGTDGAHHFVGGQRIGGVVHRHGPALARRQQGRGSAYARLAPVTSSTLSKTSLLQNIADPVTTRGQHRNYNSM
jgi:hypothetical protein